MKFTETHFTDYINKTDIIMHPQYTSPENINDINNIIIYGPPGIGKYTYALNIIKTYSESKLKYEKKFTITYNKNNFYFKISDIHYEIDMSLLGCNSKLLWFDIYNQITDIIYAKNVKTGIILCKNFNAIHNELLEIFYSYMQTQFNSNIVIKFVIITSEISFIPENITNSCEKIVLQRPAKSMYNKIFKIKLDKEYDVSLINNIKDIKDYKNRKTKYNILQVPHHNICNEIIDCIIDYTDIKYIQLRENLYDICIFELNIYNCIIYIINELDKKNKLSREKFNKIMIKLVEFLKLYNNNYRPIYHLERYILYIISVIYEL